MLVRLIFTFFLCATPLFAETINVFTQNPRAEIYIDEDFAGRGIVKNYEVAEGSHYVRVTVGNREIYAQVVEIEFGRVKTITVDKFVEASSPLPNRGSLLHEAKRAMDSRGRFAVGLNGSYLPGLSVKGFLTDRIGLQGTFWMLSFDGTRYATWEARGIFTIVNTLINRMPGSVYVASGYGQKTLEFNHIDYFDVVLGVEFALGSPNRRTNYHIHDKESLLSALVGAMLFQDNAYLSLELGYGSLHSERKADPSYQGMIGRVGLHYYF